jgi:prepilin-type N-terminal cleavage/methylation domain-containing protein
VSVKTQDAKHQMQKTRASATGAAGFTLIELLTVVAIIAIISVIAVPAIKSLGKSNDQAQAANLVRAMLSAARSMAISQHRMAGVAFYEENKNGPSALAGAGYHGANTTAMALFVELYEQTGVPAGQIGFDYYGSSRQYLPEGIRMAALSDDVTNNGNVVAEDTQGSRIIMFDANGNLTLRGDIYSVAYRWGPFSSYPGIFLYNKAEYDAQPDANKIAWLKKNSTVIIVNGNTGGLLR